MSVLVSLRVEDDLMQGLVRSFEESDGLACLEDVKDQVPDLFVLLPHFLQRDDSGPAQALKSFRDIRPDQVCQAWWAAFIVSTINMMFCIVASTGDMDPDQVLPKLSDSLLHLELSFNVL